MMDNPNECCTVFYLNKSILWMNSALVARLMTSGLLPCRCHDRPPPCQASSQAVQFKLPPAVSTRNASSCNCKHNYSGRRLGVSFEHANCRRDPLAVSKNGPKNRLWTPGCGRRVTVYWAAKDGGGAESAHLCGAWKTLLNQWDGAEILGVWNLLHNCKRAHSHDDWLRVRDS